MARPDGAVTVETVAAVAAATGHWRAAVRAVGWLGLTVTATLLLATAALMASAWSEPVRPLGGSPVADAIGAVSFAAWSAVGVMVVRGRPANRIGLILLVAGLSAQTWMLAHQYAALALSARGEALPGAVYAAAAADLWLAPVAFGLAFTFLFLLFPDGRLPSPRWRPFAWFVGASLAFWTLTWGTSPGQLGGAFSVFDNPAGIALVGRIDPGVGWLLFVLSVLGSACSLVVRLRWSTGMQRIQLKWFTYTAAMVALTWVVVTIGSDAGPPFTTLGGLMFPVAVSALPLAVFVAVFRHQLYDIDVVISRTIVVGLLAALVTGGYVAAVALVGTAIGRSGETGLGVAMVATALVAVAFQPVRASAQRLAKRIVYGRRATPYELLTAFTRRTGEFYAADDLLPHLTRILCESFGATRAEAWLLVDRHLHRKAVWPAAGAGVDAVLADSDQQLSLPGTSEVVSVRHRGGLVGALAVTLPPGQGLGASDRRLLSDLAVQVGAALDNVRLVEELKASRSRIVTAQDEERRRIERDIHDGVQQRLVALALALRMAGSGLGSVPDGATAGSLAEAAQEARAALEELRRLARGIHPAIVSEGGLGAALESLAERCPVPTEVAAVPARRLPAPVEVAVYYLVAEALSNTVKHAEASSVRVTVERSEVGVRVEVADDGVGGATPGAGSGLIGLADRVAAVDGTLQVDSPPGQGTVLRAEIPCVSW